MKIRFRIHDRAKFPDGAILDVPKPTVALQEALREGADGVSVADVTLRTDFGVGYGNLWLSEPTLDALAAELARLGAAHENLNERRKTLIAARKARG